MMRLLIISIMALIAGCAAHDYRMERDTITIKVIEDSSMPDRGYAGMGDKLCTIVLRKYPECLGHEVMHCLSGHWHEHDSNEFCDR